MLQSSAIMHHKDLLNELAQQDPTQVRAWLETIWARRPDVSLHFNWIGLFEIAMFNAMAAAELCRKQESLAWANVAKSIYVLLTDHNERRPKSAVNSLMLTRASLIATFGTCANHDILDADDIVNWFFSELDMSYSEAVQAVAVWSQKLDLDMMRKLRNIKNRLLVMERLFMRDQLLMSEALCNWLDLKPLLP